MACQLALLTHYGLTHSLNLPFYLYLFIYLYLTRQVSEEQILIYNDGQTQTTLGQFCFTIWDIQSRPVVKQAGFEPQCL